MSIWQKIWSFTRFWHPVFLVVPSLVIGVLAALWASGDDKIMPAVIGLLGAIIGGVLAAGINLIVANTNQRTQLTTSIWPARLKAHQEAFGWWGTCCRVVMGDDRNKEEINEAHAWWMNNCLYLSEESRERFFNMINKVRMHQQLIYMQNDKDLDQVLVENVELVKYVHDTGAVITRSAGLHVPDDLIKEMTKRVEEVKPPP